MTHKFKTAGKYACLVRPDRTELYEVGVINAYLVGTIQNRGYSPLDATVTDEGIVWAIYPDGEIVKSSWEMDLHSHYWQPFLGEYLTSSVIESATAPDGTVVVAALGGDYCYVLRGVEGRFTAQGCSNATISPDGKYVAAWGLLPRIIRVYATETHRFVAQYDTRGAYNLAFSQCGEYILLSEFSERGGKKQVIVRRLGEHSDSRSFTTLSEFPLEFADLGSAGVLVAPSGDNLDSSPVEIKPLVLVPPLNQWRKDYLSEARYYPREVVPAKLPLHSLQLGDLDKGKISVVYGMEGESIVKIGYAGDKFEPDFGRLEAIS